MLLLLVREEAFGLPFFCNLFFDGSNVTNFLIQLLSKKKYYFFYNDLVILKFFFLIQLNGVIIYAAMCFWFRLIARPQLLGSEQ